MLVKSSGISDVGLKREGNEDYFSTEDSSGLYVVADGMGGHLAGEVASRVVVEMINKSFSRCVEEQAQQDELFGYPDSSLTKLGNYILSSVRLANRVCYEMALGYEQYHGMGTTVVILLVTSSVIIAANVGDSRIYRVRNGHIERLSRDHTIVAEQLEMGVLSEEDAVTSPLRHILTRNLGSAEAVEVDIFEIEPTNNDRFILCSDGLTDLVSDQEILEMAQNEHDPEDLGRKLVDTVLKRGAHDNTTIVSVFLADMKKKKAGPLRKIGLLLADIVTSIQNIIKQFKP